MSRWALLSSHGAVLVYVGKHPHVPSVEIANAVGLRERNVVRVIDELVDEGYLNKQLVERTNRYEVNTEMVLRRPMMKNVTVGQFLQALLPLVEGD